MPKIQQDESMSHTGPSNLNTLMEAVYNDIWKEGKPFVRTEGGVEVLVDHLEAMAGQSLVMVRSEYLRIFQHIMVMPTLGKTCTGLVLTGHPGVGKTMFLYYALGAALAAHMPVVFCDTADSCILFDDRGVHMVYPLANYPFEHRTLFLVDSNSAIHSPPGAFLRPILGGMIVQATSPDPSHWKQWAKQVRALTWVLGLWEREEMLALQRAMEASRQSAWTDPPPGTSYYTPVELFDLLGPSARACTGPPIVKTQHGPQADFAAYLSLPTLSPNLESVLHMVYCPGTPRSSYEINDLDRIFFLSNAGRPNPNPWPRFHYGVPTLFLCRTLCAALRARPKATQRRVATTYAPSPAAAAPFYLPLALDLLVGARARHTCHIVHQASGPQRESSEPPTCSFHIGPGLSLRAAPFPLPPHLDSDIPTSTPNLDSVDDNTVLAVPLPPISASSAPSPAFHALVVSADKTRATLLRMAALADSPNAHASRLGPRGEADFARDRETIRAAIRAFDRSHPGEKEDVRWTLVYVALKGRTAERAARSEDARAVLGDLRGRVAVGWLGLQGEDKGAKALLNAFEKEAEEIKEYYEKWIAQHSRPASSPRNATTGSIVDTLPTRERGIFASAAARLKARHRDFLPCLNV